jgi:hypothetical protein
MTKNSPKAPRIALKKPSDARRLIRRVLAEIFAQNAEVEQAGKIASLLNVWVKLFELETFSDLERRISVLEEKSNEKKSR